MNILPVTELKNLIEARGQFCVSIYLTTHCSSTESPQDRLRLKNLLSEAEKGLIACGLRPPEVQELLAPAETLLGDGLFWRKQSDGLAIFLMPGIFRTFCLPLEFPELVLISHRFHVKPLLPLLSGDGKFYLLILDLNGIRLLQGSRYSITEIELKDLPGSLAEALRFDQFEKQLFFHTGTQATGMRGKRQAIFYGHGAKNDRKKIDIRRYFHQIDSGICALLRNERGPLILAGVEYLLALYQEVNSYPNLMKQGIQGSPEEISIEDLHQGAWAIVEPDFSKAKGEADATFRRLRAIGHPQASDNLKQIISAAHYGQVEVLFVASGVQQFGTFDPETGLIQNYSTPGPGDEDLLDYAAACTLLNRGTVYLVEPEKMPSGAQLAALLRY